MTQGLFFTTPPIFDGDQMPGEAAHSDIPSHGLNDQEMIEMAAFEEFRLLGRELGHAEDYS